MSEYIAEMFSKDPNWDDEPFKPESLLSRPISDRHFAHAGFVVGCLVQQQIIQPQPNDEGLTQFMDAILIVARCLDMLPANGDWPKLPFDWSADKTKDDN